MAAKIDIELVSKRVPWVDDLAVEGPDYSGAAFKMEIRQRQGDGGPALVTLNTATAGSEGISCTYEPSYADPETGETFAASIVLIQINETTMEGLATGTPPDSPVQLVYDIHVTPVSGPKFVLCYGKFTYWPGVTL